MTRSEPAKRRPCVTERCESERLHHFSPASSPVRKTLATVARKSCACSRQRARGRAAGAPSDGLEGIAEGGGEPLESGGEAGIEGAKLGVHAERAAGKLRVREHVDDHPVRAAEPGAGEQRLQ